MLERLAQWGLVKGKTVGIDATTLEANAPLRSIVRRDTDGLATNPAQCESAPFGTSMGASALRTPAALLGSRIEHKEPMRLVRVQVFQRQRPLLLGCQRLEPNRLDTSRSEVYFDVSRRRAMPILARRSRRNLESV